MQVIISSTRRLSGIYEFTFEIAQNRLTEKVLEYTVKFTDI